MADPISIATLGLALAGTAAKTAGSMQSDQASEVEAQQRSEIAGIQADQTVASSMFNLKRSIGNIKAVVAGSNNNIYSPTSQAILDEENTNSLANLSKKTDSIKLQQGQDSVDEAAYAQKSSMALMGGALGLGADYLDYRKGN